MQLHRLKLQNFRQHADTEIVFGPGLTAIIGPNGAGKTTLLEGIAWAFYGNPAARGSRESIRWNRAPAIPSRVTDAPRWAYSILINPSDVRWDGSPAEGFDTTGMELRRTNRQWLGSVT